MAVVPAMIWRTVPYSYFRTIVIVINSFASCPRQCLVEYFKVVSEIHAMRQYEVILDVSEFACGIVDYCHRGL